MREIFHRKITFKLVDATCFYAASIVIFCFLTYILAAWQLFYDKQTDFQIVADQNPGVALVELKLDKKAESDDKALNGVVSGNEARFIYEGDIIIPDKEGRFVLSLKGA